MTDILVLFELYPLTVYTIQDRGFFSKPNPISTFYWKTPSSQGNGPFNSLHETVNNYKASASYNGTPRPLPPSTAPTPATATKNNVIQIDFFLKRRL